MNLDEQPPTAREQVATYLSIVAFVAAVLGAAWLALWLVRKI